ncbi:SLATT domain-containing protein (plasmid) [Arsenophonus sp. aPb]|uniref:SLATT domain-containing protein n=1 Tax=Arsenophonus sp. aPb TaxID=3041619 RepID=UPI0024692D90|nr:SLATT domain-containing protein [Arsenophonus sp. aPb]WGL99929.1 SLATT domain-containing protein [Arsenophonus sp. aPb]
MTDNYKILEGQLRECYGRIIYSHKTHEKCADILFNRHKFIKCSQIVLSAFVTGGLVTALFDFSALIEYKKLGTLVAVLLSTILLTLNSYIKDYDLGEIAQKHRQAGADLWIIREKYLSLLTDLRMKTVPLNDLCLRRDKLTEDLHAVYTGAPSTNYKAYVKAQKALKELEDMTFSDDEIDEFLPKELRRK